MARNKKPTTGRNWKIRNYVEIKQNISEEPVHQKRNQKENLKIS